MKKFVKFLLFSQDNGLIDTKNYSIKSSFNGYIKFFISDKIDKNKYNTIINTRNLFIKIISLIYYPAAIVLYLLNIRIVGSNSFSIGTYCEEIEYTIISNEEEEKKLFLLSPSSFCANNYLDNLIFKKKIKIFKNNFICLMLLPLSFIDFIRFTPYKIKNDEKIFFEKQFYYSKKLNLSGYLDHDIFHEKLIIKKNLIKLLDLNFEKKIFSELKELLALKNEKICILHIRDAKDNKLRNFALDPFKKTIKYLCDNNFKVINFTETNSNFVTSGYHEFDILKNQNKRLQILSLVNADLFLGSQSGPAMISKFLETPAVIVNAINFNNLYQNENYRIIFKKYFLNDRILNLNKIFKNNLECIWNNKILEELNIRVEDNNEDEIYYATKEIIQNVDNKSIKVMDYLDSNEINFNNLKHSILRNTSNYFLEKNNFLV